MDKKSLVEILECARNDSYSWALYFFKIDRRNNNPYTAWSKIESHIITGKKVIDYF